MLRDKQFDTIKLKLLKHTNFMLQYRNIYSSFKQIIKIHLVTVILSIVPEMH